MIYEVLESRRRLGNAGDKIKLTKEQAELYGRLGLVKEANTHKKEKKENGTIDEGSDPIS